MTTVIINGVTYTSGRDIVINNGKISIDGVDATPNEKEIQINITGDINNLKVDHCGSINVIGNVDKLNSVSGDVDVSGNITDSVNSTSGDIECGGIIGGNVKTVSGDINCGNVSGDANTVSGDIKYKKF